MKSLENWIEEYRYKGAQYVVLPWKSLYDYAENPQVRRLYLTDVGFFPEAKNHYIERQNGCDEYIYFFCTHGRGTIVIDSVPYILHENEAFCIPKGKRHTYYAASDTPWSILWMHIKGDDTLYYPLEKCQIVKLDPHNTAHRIQFLFEQMFRVLEEEYSMENFIYLSQTASLILSETYLRKREIPTEKQNMQVVNVIKYMYNNLDKNLSLEQIVQEFDFSKSYLNIAFQKYTRHAPMDYFLKLKMQKACELLQKNNGYIYEVAQQLGYSDQYYFSRIFKKVTGVSPKEYQKNYPQKWAR